MKSILDDSDCWMNEHSITGWQALEMSNIKKRLIKWWWPVEMTNNWNEHLPSSCHDKQMKWLNWILTVEKQEHLLKPQQSWQFTKGAVAEMTNRMNVNGRESTVNRALDGSIYPG